MPSPLKYIIVLLPVTLTLGTWQLATFLFQHFNCQGDIKHMRDCYAGNLNLLPLMEIGLFWAPLLSFVTGPISFALFVKAAVGDISRCLKSNREVE